MKKTMIAVPCMDQVPAIFAQSLTLLQKPENTCLSMQMGSLIYAARNSLAAEAIKQEADYVFWMDSDMLFPTNALVKMIDTLEKNELDILTGVYFRRRPPYTPTLFEILDMYGEACSHRTVREIPEGLFEVAGCGFGCVLLTTDVLMSVQAKFGNMFAPIGNNGEDVAFCWRARQCGYKIMCDPSVVCGHVGYSVVDDKFFKAFNNAKE